MVLPHLGVLPLPTLTKMATVNDQAKSKARQVFDFAREMKRAESVEQAKGQKPNKNIFTP